MTAPFSSVSGPMSTTPTSPFGGQRRVVGHVDDRHVCDAHHDAAVCGRRRERLRGGETLLEVGEDVVDALDADGEPHQARA